MAVYGQPQAQGLQPLDPHEEDSVLSKLTGGAMSGLSYVGGVLDKTFGGRAIRGILGGKPRELLSILPGSDTLGITNEHDVVRGRDLLDPVLGKSTPGFDLGDIAGFGADVLLDPATYLTFGAGALNKTGQLARSQGNLAKTAAGRIAAKQGGLAGIGLPFMEPSAVLGTGPAAQKIAEAGGSLVEKAKYSGPGRLASALFDKDVAGRTSEPVQRALRGEADALRAGEAAVRGKVSGWGHDLLNAGELSGSSNPMRSALEDTLHGPLPQAQGKVASDLQQYLAGMPGAENAMGVESATLENFAPRHKTLLPNATKGYGGRPVAALDPFDSGMIHRLEAFQDVPGGTVHGLNPMMKDPAISGPARTLQTPNNSLLGAETQHIKTNYLGLGKAEQDQLAFYHDAINNGFDPHATYPPDVLAKLQAWDRLNKQAPELASIAAGMDPKYAAEGLDFFSNHLLNDVMTRGLQHERRMSRARALHDAVSTAATDMAAAGPGAVRVDQALAKAGLGNVAGANTTAEATLQGLDKIPRGGSMFDLYVPKHVADDLARAGVGYSSPEAVKPLLDAWDSMTNLTKAFQTALWPAKHIRDYAQGIWQRFVHGHADPRFHSLDPRAWIAPQQEASAILREGKVLADAHTFPGLQGLTPEQATQQLAREMFAHKVAGPSRLTRDLDGLGEHYSQKNLHLPGDPQKGLGEILRGVVPGSKAEANPLGITGVGSNTTNTFAPVRAGREVEELTNDLNRGASYLAMRRKGLSPEAAAAEVQKAHYDYSNLSLCEKSVMRRTVPFYSWLRSNLPAQLEQLATHPGGVAAQGIRAAEDMRADAGGFIPEHIGQGLAIPLGTEADGTQRFLSHLGLPFEDAFQHMGVGRGLTGNVEKSLSSLMGEANPLIKAPIELATGKQLYSGRDLADLHPLSGNVLVDQALTNSPLSRFATTARTLADERKGVLAKAANLVSPGRITDVDMNKARTVAARELIDQQLRGEPGVHHFETLYAKPENLAQMTPQEIALLRLNKTIEQRSQQEARAKKIRVQ